jgi:diadenosine tetraphosphate (Ap4A) HIT family hydrolase
VTKSDEFELHPRLAADAAFVADWPLSRVLLMDDARYFWLILVPRRAGLSELHDLAAGDRAIFVDEIVRASAGLKAVSKAVKINTGALGNIVDQLHIHMVARTLGDPAWPGPVWGHSPAVPYERGLRERRIAELRARL